VAEAVGSALGMWKLQVDAAALGRTARAFDRLRTYEVGRNNVNHPWLLEFHRQRL